MCGLFCMSYDFSAFQHSSYLSMRIPCGDLKGAFYKIECGAYGLIEDGEPFKLGGKWSAYSWSVALIDYNVQCVYVCYNVLCTFKLSFYTK